MNKIFDTLFDTLFDIFLNFIGFVFGVADIVISTIFSLIWKTK